MNATKIQEARSLAERLRACAKKPWACEGCYIEKNTKRFDTMKNAAAMIESLTGELESQGQQNPNTAAKIELLHTLCGVIASRQNPWDAGIMDQLLPAWDTGTVIADPLTVALLAPKLEWAKKCLGKDPYLADELYARLLLTVIPAICPALDENEEEAEPNDGKD